MADYIIPTPRNPILGLLADAMMGGLSWMDDPRRTQQMRGVGGLLSDTGIAQTLDRLASGEPLTKGSGFATRMKPETANVVMTLAPEAVPIGRAAMAGVRAAERGAMAAGRAGERYAERVVPQIMERGGLPAEIVSAMGQGTQSPMIVWHGSPHRFTKFDSSKIGTGEGAQAYGHGLYLAESPGVASQYRKQLAGWPKEAKNIVNEVSSLGVTDDAAREVLSLAASVGKKEFDIDTAAKWLGYRSRELRDLSDAQRKEILLRMSQIETPGSLYKVDLPDKQIAKMLDWDKPLSEQAPNVQQIIGDELKRIGGSAHTGERAYKELMFNARMAGMQSASPMMRNNTEAAAASNRLREMGIPGIRYLDQGSRGQGKGTSNFVVFPGEEDLLRILSVNGGLLAP